MARVIYLIPAISCNEWLIACIQSIEEDSYKDKEILVVDNGVDNIDASLLKERTGVVSKISVVKERTQGVAPALNRGIDLCDSEYIARLDADDLVIRGRTGAQLEVLDSNPSVAGVGGNAVLINEQGQKIGRLALPRIKSLDEMRCTLRFENPYVHPAMMLRTSLMRSFRYDVSKSKCQDWDLWMRMALERHLIVNINKQLIFYRRHSTQQSVTVHDQWDSLALKHALTRFDPCFASRYFFHRPYLEDAPITVAQLGKILRDEAANVRNIYSLKKLAAHLIRAVLR